MVVCVYFMTGNPKGSTKSGFMEKPEIEPATPGLQDIRYPLHHEDWTQARGSISILNTVLLLY